MMFSLMVGLYLYGITNNVGSVVTYNNSALDIWINSSSSQIHTTQDAYEFCTKIFQSANLSTPPPLPSGTFENKSLDRNSATEKIQLFISAYYEGPGGSWDGSGCIPAIEMALDHINAREDVLAEYELQAIWDDSKVKEYYLYEMSNKCFIVFCIHFFGFNPFRIDNM